MVSALLGGRRHRARSLRYTPSGQSAGRRSGLVSRSVRQSRLARASLSTSGHIVGIRRRRKRRPALSLSWLAVRRDRTVSGDAGGAKGQQVSTKSKASFVSGPGIGWFVIRVFGTGKKTAAAAAICAAARSRWATADRTGAARGL